MRIILFIAHRKPHKTVSTQTLSKWIKETLNKSVYCIFSAYSTCHTSTSAAKHKGVNIDIPEKCRIGQNSQTLLRNFYNLRLKEDNTIILYMPKLF